HFLRGPSVGECDRVHQHGALGRIERFTTRDMDGNETWRALATSALFSSNTRAYPVPKGISIGRVILAGLTEELPRLHGAGEMAKLHASHLEFAIDFDAEPIARRDLEWGGARPTDGPAARRLQSQGAFVLVGHGGDSITRRRHGFSAAAPSTAEQPLPLEIGGSPLLDLPGKDPTRMLKLRILSGATSTPAI